MMTPLYPNSRISADESQLMLSSFICRHHLSKHAQRDLLSLLQIHLPPSGLNTLTKSLYLFENYQSVASSDFKAVEPEEHAFCGKCYIPVSSQSSPCPNILCNNEDNEDEHATFMTMSIAEQLKTLLKRKLCMHACVCELSV